jgi:hypothetical protein
MNAPTIEDDALLIREALRILCYVINSALHHLPADTVPEDAGKHARGPIAAAQSALMHRTDAAAIEEAKRFVVFASSSSLHRLRHRTAFGEGFRLGLVPQ